MLPQNKQVDVLNLRLEVNTILWPILFSLSICSYCKKNKQKKIQLEWFEAMGFHSIFQWIQLIYVEGVIHHAASDAGPNKPGGDRGRENNLMHSLLLIAPHYVKE